MMTNCPRCSAQGQIRAFSHYANGVCFLCGGAKRIEVKVQEAPTPCKPFDGFYVLRRSPRGLWFAQTCADTVADAQDWARALQAQDRRLALRIRRASPALNAILWTPGDYMSEDDEQALIDTQDAYFNRHTAARAA